MKYALRYAPLLILALLFTLLRLAGWGQQGQHHSTPDNRSVFAPRPGSEALYSVAMLSSQDAWAVGGTFGMEHTSLQDKQINVAVPGNGLILHYTVNGGWQPDNVAGNITEPLLGVSMDSPRDGWAVGYNGMFVHYDGNAWSTEPGPTNFNKNIVGVAMLSPADGWAVGYGGSILHYDGKQWAQIQSPTSSDLHSIAMSSTQEGWIVGDNGTMLHFSNGSWHATTSPTQNALNNISMLSTNEGWAVGNNSTILHYRNGVWESVYNAFNNAQSISLISVAMSSVRSGWIIGDQYFLTYHAEVWLESAYAPYADIGKYSEATLYSVALSPSNQGWAVGGVDDGTGRTILLILHYQNGKWSVSPIIGQ